MYRKIIIVVVLFIILLFLVNEFIPDVNPIQKINSVIFGSRDTDHEDLCREILIASRLYDERGATFKFTEVTISNDKNPDYIVEIQSEQSCGSGGCIREICITDNNNFLKLITFGYSSHQIKVLNTKTNGMHDLRINDSKLNKMFWDGERYQLEAN